MAICKMCLKEVETCADLQKDIAFISSLSDITRIPSWNSRSLSESICSRCIILVKRLAESSYNLRSRCEQAIKSSPLTPDTSPNITSQSDDHNISSNECSRNFDEVNNNDDDVANQSTPKKEVQIQSPIIENLNSDTFEELPDYSLLEIHHETTIFSLSTESGGDATSKREHQRAQGMSKKIKCPHCARSYCSLNFQKHIEKCSTTRHGKSIRPPRTCRQKTLPQSADVQPTVNTESIVTQPGHECKNLENSSVLNETAHSDESRRPKETASDSFQCEFCSVSMSTLRKLRNHERVHFLSYQCDLCSCRLSTLIEYQFHRAECVVKFEVLNEAQMNSDKNIVANKSPVRQMPQRRKTRAYSRSCFLDDNCTFEIEQTATVSEPLAKEKNVNTPQEKENQKPNVSDRQNEQQNITKKIKQDETASSALSQINTRLRRAKKDCITEKESTAKRKTQMAKQSQPIVCKKSKTTAKSEDVEAEISAMGKGKRRKLKLDQEQKEKEILTDLRISNKGMQSPHKAVNPKCADIIKRQPLVNTRQESNAKMLLANNKSSGLAEPYLKGLNIEQLQSKTPIDEVSPVKHDKLKQLSVVTKRSQESNKKELQKTMESVLENADTSMDRSLIVSSVNTAKVSPIKQKPTPVQTDRRLTRRQAKEQQKINSTQQNPTIPRESKIMENDISQNIQQQVETLPQNELDSLLRHSKEMQIDNREMHFNSATELVTEDLQNEMNSPAECIESSKTVQSEKIKSIRSEGDAKMQSKLSANLNDMKTNKDLEKSEHKTDEIQSTITADPAQKASTKPFCLTRTNSMQSDDMESTITDSVSTIQHLYANTNEQNEDMQSTISSFVRNNSNLYADVEAYNDDDEVHSTIIDYTDLDSNEMGSTITNFVRKNLNLYSSNVDNYFEETETRSSNSEIVSEEYCSQSEIRSTITSFVAKNMHMYENDVIEDNLLAQQSYVRNNNNDSCKKLRSTRSQGPHRNLMKSKPQRCNRLSLTERWVNLHGTTSTSDLSQSDNDNLKFQSSKEEDLSLLDILKNGVKFKFLRCLELSCSYKTERLDNLMLHDYETHFNRGWFYCQKCKHCFTRKVFLDYHLELQEDKGRFACHRCAQIFTDQYQLDRHLIQHAQVQIQHKTSEDKFLCKYCNYEFIDQFSLRKHCQKQGHSCNTKKKSVNILSCIQNRSRRGRIETKRSRFNTIYKERVIRMPKKRKLSTERQTSVIIYKQPRFGVATFFNAEIANCVLAAKIM